MISAAFKYQVLRVLAISEDSQYLFPGNSHFSFIPLKYAIYNIYNGTNGINCINNNLYLYSTYQNSVQSASQQSTHKIQRKRTMRTKIHKGKIQNDRQQY